MKNTRLRHSEYSRREFLAQGAMLGAPLLGAGLFSAGNAFGAGGTHAAKQYRVVRDWPQGGCPRIISRGIDADSKGQIYVAGDDRYPVMMIGAKGKYLGEWGKNVLVAPHGLRVQHDTVWVTDVETHCSVSSQMAQSLR